MSQATDGEADKVVISKDLYDVLGISRDATESQIKRAYHKLAMLHHPDKRASNPTGCDETMKEISYAYKVLSDPEKRTIYDAGGTEALEEQEGMANVNLDQLLLNILMWESSQKACFLCALLFVVIEVVVIPFLVSLRLDGSLDWSWFEITAPLWIPMGLTVLPLVLAPIAIYRQYDAGKNDPQLVTQARATCMGCMAATLFLVCIATSGVLLCEKLDGGGQWTYQQAFVPLYVLEAVLLVTYLGAPARLIVEGVLWKCVRVAFLVMVGMRLDGAGLPWLAILSPLVAGLVIALAQVAYEVLQHGHLKAKTSHKDVTMEEEASRYAPFIFAIRLVLLIGAGGALTLVLLKLVWHVPVLYLEAGAAVVVSAVVAYGMVAWGLLCFQPAGLHGAGDYEQFESESDTYGTFTAGTSAMDSQDYP